MRKQPLILGALAGAATVGGYAPYDWFVLPVLTLAILVTLWQHAASARAAALIGVKRVKRISRLDGIA